ncbi:hypothetical protein RB195_024501 [Necator americanus]|uniref:Uncharacterized protein n=1 Tax=Necator americanus TaxID=51031 RepID=A0ABR1EQN7_NECAM
MPNRAFGAGSIIPTSADIPSRLTCRPAQLKVIEEDEYSTQTSPSQDPPLSRSLSIPKFWFASNLGSFQLSRHERQGCHLSKDVYVVRKFKKGEYLPDDSERSDRPPKLKIDELRDTVKADMYVIPRESQ